MGTTLWRIAKWLLLAWAGVSLLGIVAVVGLGVWFERQHEAQAAGVGVDVGQGELDRVGAVMMAAGMPLWPQPGVAHVEQRYCSPGGASPAIEAWRVRFSSDVVREVAQGSAVSGTALLPPARTAFDRVDAALRAHGQDWWPDTGGAGSAWAHVEYDAANLASYSVARLAPDGRTLVVAQGFRVRPDDGPGAGRCAEAH
jgi:hypothetical protein